MILCSPFWVLCGIADPLGSCVMLLCGPLRYLVTPHCNRNRNAIEIHRQNRTHCTSKSLCVTLRSELANGRLRPKNFLRSVGVYSVILISRAWIRRIVLLFSGRWGNCPIKFLLKLALPSFTALSEPNGSAFGSGKIFKQKKDNRPTYR